MSDFQEFKNANRRWAILHLLSQDDDRSLNHRLIKRGLEDYDHKVGMGTVEGDLKWLEQRGLIKVEEIAMGMMSAKLLELGLSVVTGDERIKGVDLPPDLF
jgi:Fe2+ or Zn2+ uptake regulation protein